jgi:hypothetical protein
MEKETIATIKTFLKSNLKGNYIYYNNPTSIKIVVPNALVEVVANFLESEEIIFQIRTPDFIVHKFRFIRNMSEVIIRK